MARNAIVAVVSIVVGLVHAVAQFMLWAYQGRINGNVGSSSSALWAAVSFPLFTVLPRAFTARFFWLVFGANSLLWAAGFLLLAMLLVGRTNIGTSSA